MKVLLISLQRDFNTIGLKYLHYSLMQNGYQSFILYLPRFNQNNDKSLENIKRFIFRLNPQMIGISLMSIEYYKACSLTQYLKTFFNFPIIWGGIHPTLSPESCLPYADYVCMGEGERTILDIVKAIEKKQNIKDIKNIAYLEGGQAKKNSRYPLIEDLDQVPSYDHIAVNSFVLTKKAVLKMNKKVFMRRGRLMETEVYSVMTTRDCPFACTYCCNNALSRLYPPHRVRRRSTLNIINELKKAIENNPEIEYISFQDDCFLACSNDYIEEFCRIYKREIAKPFIIRTIPIYINSDKISFLREAGLAWVNLGLQSGSDYILKEVYKRHSSTADFLKAANILKDFEVAAFYDIIVDNPFENKEDMLKTAEVLSETPRPFYPQFFSLVFYYGTELYEKAKAAYPQYMKDYLTKDFSNPDKNIPDNKITNNIIRLAAFIDKEQIKKVISLYRNKPKSIKFKILLYYSNFLAWFIFQPKAILKMIYLSQQRSYPRALRVLPIYCREGLRRYLNQLRDEL